MKKHLRYKFLPQTLRLGLIISLALIGISLGIAAPVHADATVVVNSTADDIDDDGECTLREAILAANTNTASGGTSGECIAGDSGHDTINFNITGAADFTNDGQSGYKIELQSGLPGITESATINGYSQTGASYNTNPQETRILIEIDCNTNGGIWIEDQDVTVRGLSMYDCDNQAIGGNADADGALVQGNYIGLSADDSTVHGSDSMGINFGDPGVDDLVIQNNIVTGITGAGNDSIWVTGVNNALIEGNIVYDGSDVGIGIGSNPSTDVIIRNNTVYGNQNEGIAVDDDATRVTITGNLAYGNRIGIAVTWENSDITIGSPGQGNTVYDNSMFNIQVFSVAAFVGQVSDMRIQSNNIGRSSGSNRGMAIAVLGDPANVLIGGTNADEANTIINSSSVGIGVSSFTVTAMSVTIHPQNVAILGNSITNSNDDLSFGIFGSGLGIDLFELIDTDSSPDGAPNTSTDGGPTANDAGDGDAGANNYINFPVLNSAKQDDDNLSVNFDLDAADSPTDEYRVEFFANDEADASGYGEGQTFLGAVTVGNGNNQSASLNLPTGTDLAGKSISATTTAVDSTATYGFGGTSEFSRAITLGAESAESELASTGQNSQALIILATITCSVAVIALAYYTKRQFNA